MMRPTVALPTGPFDLDQTQVSQSTFDARISALRGFLRDLDVTHAIIHGSVFDHQALAHFTYFTPKLGPAYALIPSEGVPRLLFSGGPGMKPSAAKLTWIADVVALRGVEADLARWLNQTAADEPAKLGLLEGSNMSRRDWQSVMRAAGGAVVDLDANYRPTAADDEPETAAQEARKLCERITRSYANTLKHGDDLRAAMLGLERMAYSAGAQDVRLLAARRPNGPPTRLPDAGLPFTGPTQVELALRYKGLWHDVTFTMTPKM